MEKPEDASVTCGKPNGKNGMETKPTPKVINEWSDDIDALLPKLVRNSCYYMIPTIEELAAKEQAEPGYLGRVNNFVVGLHGVGSIKFLGEIDLRGVELDSNFEIVPGSMGYSGVEPLPLQGFNGTAEMTMLVPKKFTLEEMRRSDIKAWIHSYAARVEKVVEDSGGQFVLYNPIVGEYKWKVKYFSGLGLIGFKRTSKPESISDMEKPEDASLTCRKPNAFGKPESISDMEKPEDASLTCPKPNGKKEIETKPTPKVINEWSDDIDALLPKLVCHSCYYMIPTMEELAAKEQAEPGYLGRVNNFVVGLHGVGSIKFVGEIDLRGVELDSNFEIVPGRIAYSVLKPLPLQGFTGTAEMTIRVPKKFTPEEMRHSDIKARVHRAAARVEKLVEDSGGQFVLYNPIVGEYKWKIKYFSGLGLIGFKPKEETSKPESISDMEKPEDAASLTCRKPNGENNIETKTSPKVTNESSDNIDALMPKLRHSYYYTKPTIEELEARERAEPGYIGRVKDFVMGRHGVGSIRFLGEIDLRGVELETFIQMVPGKITYGRLKPLPPQEFNDTAEFTLVTTKDKFTKKEMGRWDIRSQICSLTRSYKKRVENDGEQFISYDPSKGEYKWRTKYFSGLGLIGFKEKEKKKMTMKNNIFINCFICSNHQAASTWNTFSGPSLVAYLF